MNDHCDEKIMYSFNFIFTKLQFDFIILCKFTMLSIINSYMYVSIEKHHAPYPGYAILNRNPVGGEETSCFIKT